MTTAQATAHAHARWHEEGIGVAVYIAPDPRFPDLGPQYLVGIAKDGDSLEVFGRSTVSFEAAFANAEVVDG